MRKILIFVSSAILVSCNNASDKTSGVGKDSDSVQAPASDPAGVPANAKAADAATIMARKQVPVLCYHNIQQTGLPLRSSQGYDIPEEKFRDQLKALADSGYKSILPEQYYNYLVYGSNIPEKSVMLTFDDSDEDQFTIAKREMDKYGFKGVFFLMTIAIGKPRYMNKEQIRQLADEGHAVECHTWDHHRTDRYVAGDWEIQLDKPKAQIEGITGKPVRYFAYPFGVWAAAGIPEIKKRGYKMAFQLSTKRDSSEPLYTARRIIVPSWSGESLLKNMRSSFK